MNMSKRYIEDHITPQELQEAINKGKTYAIIAKELGFGRSSMSAYGRRNGVKSKNSRHIADVLSPIKLHQLLAKGTSYKEMGDLYNFDPGTIRRYAKRVLNIDNATTFGEILAQVDDITQTAIKIARQLECSPDIVRYHRRKRVTGQKTETIEPKAVCKSCEWVGWEDNEIQPDGRCTLCHLQDENEVILYSELETL